MMTAGVFGMNVGEQIRVLKAELIAEAEKHNLNLQHPAVLKLSCDLDRLILSHMKSRSYTRSTPLKLGS